MGDPEAWGINRIIAVVGTPVGILIAFAVVAAVFYFAGSVIGGGNATFKQNLAVYSHASLIGVPASAIGSVLVQIKESVDISLSPALFLSADLSDTFFYDLISHFDFFTVWTFILASIGYSVIYKFSTVKSYLSVGILWLIWIAISESAKSVFGGFMGM